MATTAVMTPRNADRHVRGALRVPNFRLHLAGQLVSQAGTWLQLVALGWLGFELTGSGTALGWVVAATFGPLLLLGPWTGALADRVDKYRLLASAQLMAAIPAVALGLLVLTESITTPLLYATALACGVAYAVENPVRNAFVAELVEHRLIPPAVSLTSAVGAVGRMLGPLGAGVLLATTDIAWCFPPVRPVTWSHWRVCCSCADGSCTPLPAVTRVRRLRRVAAARRRSSTSGFSAAPRSVSASSPGSSRSRRPFRSPLLPVPPAALPDCCSSPRPLPRSSNIATLPCVAG